MERVIKELQSAAGDINGVLRLLRKQEETSRLAGFRGIARLCREMDDYLAEACRGEQSPPATLVVALLDVCRAVELHADAVAKGVIRLTGER